MSERILRSRRSRVRQRMERAESGESVIGRGRNRADTWRVVSRWVTWARQRRRTQRKCRLGDAGLSGKPAP